MGHRSYLYCTKEKKGTLLFEANNSLPLFADFRDYLLRQRHPPDDTLGLDLIALAGFTSVAEYWQDLDRQALQERERAAKPALRPKKRFKIIHLLLYLAILMLCPFFTYMAYTRVVQDDWSGEALLAIFCDFLFYLFGIYGIVGQINAWRNSYT